MNELISLSATPNQVFSLHTIMFKGRKEENVLFNDTLNMALNISDSKKGNLLRPLNGLLFLISSKCSFISTDRLAHILIFVTPVVEHWLD